MDRYDAAYRLGAAGDEGVGILMAALREEGSRRVQANIEAELATATKLREDADNYAEDVQNSARVAAEALMT